MKAVYRNDTTKGPGHGYLELSDVAQVRSLEGAAFLIKRASDQKCLGKSGWQPAETLLPPSGFTLTDEGYALAVGPEVVDWLDTRETYRLTLKCADGESFTGTLRVPEVAYSAQDGGQGIASVTAAAPPPPPVEPAPPPPPPLEEEPEPLPEPEPVQEEQPLPPPPPPLKKNSLLPVFIVLVALAVAGAGGFAVWKYLLNSDPTAPEPVTEASPAEPAPKPPLTQAREHLAGTADPAEGMKLAKELRDKENGADGAFLLAEDAAGKGNTEAMLMTGSYYDPADTAPSGTIVKDPSLALTWYKKAKSAGNAEADARLAALRAWAEAEDAKGNPQAKELLTKF